MNRLKLVKASIVVAFAVGFSLSFHLWIGEERNFPLIKPIDVIPSLASPFQLILILTFISLCAAWIFIENRWIGLIALGTLIIVLSQAQMRWQPWVYLYLLMLLPYLLPSHKGSNHKVINYALIDDFHFFLNPIAIGKGIPAFGQLSNWQSLKFKNPITCYSGLIILHYERQ